jgi:hypothetical protein
MSGTSKVYCRLPQALVPDGPGRHAQHRRPCRCNARKHLAGDANRLGRAWTFVDQPEAAGSKKHGRRCSALRPVPRDLHLRRLTFRPRSTPWNKGSSVQRMRRRRGLLQREKTILVGTLNAGGHVVVMLTSISLATPIGLVARGPLLTSRRVWSPSVWRSAI